METINITDEERFLAFKIEVENLIRHTKDPDVLKGVLLACSEVCSNLLGTNLFADAMLLHNKVLFAYDAVLN